MVFFKTLVDPGEIKHRQKQLKNALGLKAAGGARKRGFKTPTELENAHFTLL